MSDWILRHIRPFRRYDPSLPVYLRYGIWARNSINHSTYRPERGLSVYQAKLVDGIVELDDETCNTLADQGRVVFAVQGREVCRGSDGEPVLQDVRHVRLPISLTAKR